MWTVADQGSTKTVTVCDSGDTSFKKKKEKKRKACLTSLSLSLWEHQLWNLAKEA
jgi:hypothetical protein